MQGPIGILGFGPRTGVSLLRHLQARHVHILDGAPKQDIEQLAAAHASPQQAYTVFSDEPKHVSSGMEKLLISPGVPLDHPVIVYALQQGIEVQTEIDFAFEKLTCPVVAITGSLGKSTMAKLTSELLSQKFHNVFLGGNYGVPLIEAVGQPYDIVVVEVSSFQLEACTCFHPNVAVLLNLYENHLDRHKTMQAYLDAKAKVFSRQTENDLAIVNYDQPMVQKCASRALKQSFSVDGNRKATIAYSTDGVVLGGALIECSWKHPATDQALALMLIAKHFGLGINQACSVLEQHQKLPHRQEVLHKEGRIFINDSKSTTPDATMFALKNFTSPTHLILCGRNKGVDLLDFVEKLQGIKHIVSITVFGEVGHALAQHFTRPNVLLVDDMQQAFEQIMRIAKREDVVLLSPGFASFDQYKNMEARGDHFKQLVKAWKP